MRLTIKDLWGQQIDLPNNGDVTIKAMCPKTLCADGNGKK
jgi:hypothetical protein